MAHSRPVTGSGCGPLSSGTTNPILMPVWCRAKRVTKKEAAARAAEGAALEEGSMGAAPTASDPSLLQGLTGERVML